MATKVKPIPDGYHSVTPYLIVKDAFKALDFYEKAFGADVKTKITGPQGRIMHAEFKIGDSVLMLTEEENMPGMKGPLMLGGSPISLLIYTKNVDEFFQRAIRAGAKQERPIQDEFFGDRMGSVSDGFGYIWHLATHIADVSEKEMQAHFDAKAAVGSEN